jgi:hypothetical protein
VYHFTNIILAYTYLPVVVKGIMAIVAAVAFVFISERFKILFYRFIDINLSYSYARFINCFDYHVFKDFWEKRLANKRDWLIKRIKAELILERASHEMQSDYENKLIDDFDSDMRSLKEKKIKIKIIATSSSTLSIWFHHAITTYFIAQTKELSRGKIEKCGLLKFERYYFLKTQKMLNDIEHHSVNSFDYWKAVQQTHIIAEKDLYLVYKANKFADIVKGNDGQEIDSYLLYIDIDKDEVLQAKKFESEDNKYTLQPIDKHSWNSLYTYIKEIEDKSIKTETKGEFFDKIKNCSGTVICKI